jgi:hypothetical protein
MLMFVITDDENMDQEFTTYLVGELGFMRFANWRSLDVPI